jgi:hypothetical protein
MLGTILGIGSIASSLIGANSQRRAADAQTDAANRQIAENRRQFNLQWDALEPAREVGQNALNRLMGHMDNMGARTRSFNEQSGAVSQRFQNAMNQGVGRFGRRSTQAVRTADADTQAATGLLEQRLTDARTGLFDRADEVAGRTFEEDPGYQFRLEQGLKARERSAAAQRNLFSGATQMGHEDFAQGLASQEYGAFDARRARDYGTELGRAGQQFGIDSGMAGTLFGADMSGIEGTFGRNYGLASDLFQADATQAGAGYDAGRARIADNYGRYIDGRNALMGAAGLGQQAIQTGAQVGANTTAGISAALGNIGQAQAQGAIGRANAWNAGMDNMFGILGAAQGGMFNQPMNWQSAFGFGGGGGTPTSFPASPSAAPVSGYGLY